MRYFVHFFVIVSKQKTEACLGPHSTTVKGRLDHAISAEDVEGWKTMDEIEAAVDIDMGDYVVHNDWVGQVRNSNFAVKPILIELVAPLGCRGTSARAPECPTSINQHALGSQMFDEAWVEVSGGNLVRLPELSARLVIGERGPVRFHI